MLKDKYGKEIKEYDIVICEHHRAGWIFKNGEQWLVGWDVSGPSCEDCSPIEEFLGKYSSIKVVGTLYR